MTGLKEWPQAGDVGYHWCTGAKTGDPVIVRVCCVARRGPWREWGCLANGVLAKTFKRQGAQDVYPSVENAVRMRIESDALSWSWFNFQDRPSDKAAIKRIKSYLDASDGVL